MDEHRHYSVLLKESIELLEIKADGVYVDGTFGYGGHAREILALLGPKGKLIAFDKDPQSHIYATQFFSDDRLILFHKSFSKIGECLASLDIRQVDGILLDLGVSSPQLDDAARGFSFRFDAQLDMRMDTSSGLSAKQWINTVTEAELADILWRYGEEKFSRMIAKAIVKKRQVAPIETTKELAEIVGAALPFKEKGKHPATRTFQAIRIFINDELGELEDMLNKTMESELLAANGNLVVISFHSLEDRIVKNVFNRRAQVENLPKWVTAAPTAPNYRISAKKIRASVKEIATNARSRSGILRAIKRIW